MKTKNNIKITTQIELENIEAKKKREKPSETEYNHTRKNCRLFSVARVYGCALNNNFYYTFRECKK